MPNDPNDRYHPDDQDGNWNYEDMPDIDEYYEKDGNLDRYDDDYDKWEQDQRK